MTEEKAASEPPVDSAPAPSPPPLPAPIAEARARGSLTLTGRGAPNDDGIVKVVVRVRVDGRRDAELLDALDGGTLTVEQRARVVALLREALPAALDAKHGPRRVPTEAP